MIDLFESAINQIELLHDLNVLAFRFFIDTGISLLLSSQVLSDNCELLI